MLAQQVGVPVRIVSPGQSRMILDGLPAWLPMAGRDGRMSRMARTPLDVDELVEHWTLLKEDRELLVGKWGACKNGVISRKPG